MDVDGGRETLDERVRTALGRDDAAGAATLIIRTLGPELLGYLWIAAKSWGDGEELFAEVCERIWRALPAFRFECSLRTWVHVIARNQLRSGFQRKQRAARVVALELADEIAAVKTTTVECLRPEARQRLEHLRQLLDEDDRTLLLLRIDREMAWRDIARVMADDDEPLDRSAARLRKRFERVKERLRGDLVMRGGDAGA